MDTDVLIMLFPQSTPEAAQQFHGGVHDLLQPILQQQIVLMLSIRGSIPYERLRRGKNCQHQLCFIE